MTVTTYDPPPGFDPLQATNAELVQAGFPPRPENPELLAHWNELFQDLDGKLTYVTPTFERMPHAREPRLKRAPRTQTAGETITNDHWSGVQVFPPSSSFYALTATWLVPTISAPDTQDYWLMTWIGIDGEEADNLVCQIGVVQNINFVADGAQQCYPFFEWYPARSSYGVNNLAVQPGNLVSLWLTTQGSGSTEATGFFANRSTGAATTATFGDQNNNPLIGHCAEWVVERPLNNDQVPMLLADYGQTYFFGCQAAYGPPNGPLSPVTPAAADATVITMVDANTTLSQATVAPSPGTEIHFQYAAPPA